MASWTLATRASTFAVWRSRNLDVRHCSAKPGTATGIAPITDVFRFCIVEPTDSFSNHSPTPCVDSRCNRGTGAQSAGTRWCWGRRPPPSRSSPAPWREPRSADRAHFRSSRRSPGRLVSEASGGRFRAGEVARPEEGADARVLQVRGGGGDRQHRDERFPVLVQDVGHPPQQLQNLLLAGATLCLFPGAASLVGGERSFECLSCQRIIEVEILVHQASAIMSNSVQHRWGGRRTKWSADKARAHGIPRRHLRPAPPPTPSSAPTGAGRALES